MGLVRDWVRIVLTPARRIYRRCTFRFSRIHRLSSTKRERRIIVRHVIICIGYPILRYPISNTVSEHDASYQLTVNTFFLLEPSSWSYSAMMLSVACFIPAVVSSLVLPPSRATTPSTVLTSALNS